jgi:hypothetical protein
MKNLRKLIATVIAVALVLTSMTSVFAADSATIANADKAVTLKDLGLYSGQDANDPKFGLESALTTQDSLIMVSFDAYARTTTESYIHSLDAIEKKFAAELENFINNLMENKKRANL